MTRRACPQVSTVWPVPGRTVLLAARSVGPLLADNACELAAGVAVGLVLVLVIAGLSASGVAEVHPLANVNATTHNTAVLATPRIP